MIQLPPPELPEIVVTGARLPPAAREAAFAVVRLTQADLRAEPLCKSLETDSSAAARRS